MKTLLQVILFAVTLGWMGLFMDSHGQVVQRPLDPPDIAQSQRAKDEKLAAAKQKACGENATYIDVDPTTIQCFTHRGHRTKSVSVESLSEPPTVQARP